MPGCRSARRLPPSPRSRSTAASTASGASTARRSATRGSRSSSPPASSAAWRSSWASPCRDRLPDAGRALEIDKLFGSMPASMIDLFGNAEADRLEASAPSAATSPASTARSSPSAPPSGRSWPCPGPWPARPAAGASTSSRRRPFGKRRIALEKLAAHLTLLWLAMVVLALMTTFSSNVFGDAALGDHDPAARRRPASPCGSASSPCSSAASRSPSRRSSAAPARPASPAS